MTGWNRLWYRLNVFSARFTAPSLTYPPAPVRPGHASWRDSTDRSPDGRGFHPFRQTLYDTPLSDLRGAALPERAWWDQRGENNPQPLDPPETLDLSGLDIIDHNYESRW